MAAYNLGLDAVAARAWAAAGSAAVTTQDRTEYAAPPPVARRRPPPAGHPDEAIRVCREVLDGRPDRNSADDKATCGHAVVTACGAAAESGKFDALTALKRRRPLDLEDAGQPPADLRRLPRPAGWPRGRLVPPRLRPRARRRSTSSTP